MRHMRGRWMLVVLCCAGLSLLVVAAPWRSAAEEGQNASPRFGNPGQRFSFFATGFDKGERVGYWATAPDGSVPAQSTRQVIANKNGRADWSWTAPANALAGTWLIAAKGVNSGTFRTLRIEIVAGNGSSQPAPPPPQSDGTSQNASPRSGGPGQRFDFFATGFRSGERVGYWVTAPGGGVPTQRARSVYANSDGRADWNWTAPADAPAGTWLIAAKGVGSGTLRTLRVEVVR